MVGRILYTIFFGGATIFIAKYLGGSNTVCSTRELGTFGLLAPSRKTLHFSCTLAVQKKSVLGGDLNHLSRVPGMTSFEVTDSLFWATDWFRSGEKKNSTRMFLKGDKKKPEEKNNQISNYPLGISPFSIGNTSSKGPFSIAISLPECKSLM